MPLAVQWLNFSNWPADVINKEIVASVIIKQQSKKKRKILYIFHEQPLNNGYLPLTPLSEMVSAPGRAPWRLIGLFGTFPQDGLYRFRVWQTKICHRLSQNIWIYFCKYCITLKVMASSSIFFLLFLTGALFWIDVFKNRLSFFYIEKNILSHHCLVFVCYLTFVLLPNLYSFNVFISFRGAFYLQLSIFICEINRNC